MDILEERLDLIEQKLDYIIQFLADNSNSKPTRKSKQNTADKPPEKQGNADVKVYMDALSIGGNTYANRIAMKKMGCQWNKETMGWVIPISEYKKVMKILPTCFESVVYNKVPDTNLLKKSDEKPSTNHNYDQGCEIDSD